MDPSRIRPRTIVLAVLCLAVIAFAAATLDSTTSPGSGIGGDLGLGDPPSGDRLDGPPGDPNVTLTPGGPANQSVIDIPQMCVGWLQGPLPQIGLLLGVVGVFLVGKRVADENAGMLAVFVVAFPGFFVYAFLTGGCTAGPVGQGPVLPDVGRPNGSTGGGLGGGGGVTSIGLTTQILLLLVAATLVGVAALVLTGDHDKADEAVGVDEDEEPEPEPTADVAAIGAAAGRAADRIESEGEFENEVYRAWAEMTEHLPVDRPKSSTPAEFATAAAAAGIDTDDVDELTGLFEEVRYGGAEPTAERERAAVETLRRIESAYAGDES